MRSHCGVFRQTEEVILPLLYEDGPGNLVEWGAHGWEGEEAPSASEALSVIQHTRDDKQKWTELRSHLESKRADLQSGKGSGDRGSEQA